MSGCDTKFMLVFFIVLFIGAIGGQRVGEAIGYKQGAQECGERK